jgi:hypothetical protein
MTRSIRSMPYAANQAGGTGESGAGGSGLVGVDLGVGEPRTVKGRGGGGISPGGHSIVEIVGPLSMRASSWAR